MLLRLTTIALCAAGVFLLATLDPVRLEILRVAPREQLDGRERVRCAAHHEPTPQLSIIDAAGQIAPADLAALVVLKPGERVAAVNDDPVLDEVPAGAIIASRRLRAGEYLDLTVSSPTTERRVLVLLH